jgi:hypothetical protein
LNALQDGALQVAYHIRGGARKTHPMRLATPEELRKFEALREALQERKASQEEPRKEMDRATAFLYKHAPSQGITEHVHRESWDAGAIFHLSIRDGHLIVEPRCSLDYPWDAYSFIIANRWVVDELWPPNAAEATEAIAEQGLRLSQEILNSVLRRLFPPEQFPDFPVDVAKSTHRTTTVERDVRESWTVACREHGPGAKELIGNSPKWDAINRALGRDPKRPPRPDPKRPPRHSPT